MEGNWLGLELVGAGLWCHGGCAARNLFRVCVLVADQSGGFWYYHHGGFQLTIVL